MVFGRFFSKGDKPNKVVPGDESGNVEQACMAAEDAGKGGNKLFLFLGVAAAVVVGGAVYFLVGGSDDKSAAGGGAAAPPPVDADSGLEFDTYSMKYTWPHNHTNGQAHIKWCNYDAPTYATGDLHVKLSMFVKVLSWEGTNIPSFNGAKMMSSQYTVNRWATQFYAFQSDPNGEGGEWWYYEDILKISDATSYYDCVSMFYTSWGKTEILLNSARVQIWDGVPAPGGTFCDNPLFDGPSGTATHHPTNPDGRHSCDVTGVETFHLTQVHGLQVPTDGVNHMNDFSELEAVETGKPTSWYDAQTSTMVP